MIGSAAWAVLATVRKVTNIMEQSEHISFCTFQREGAIAAGGKTVGVIHRRWVVDEKEHRCVCHHRRPIITVL